MVLEKVFWRSLGLVPRVSKQFFGQWWMERKNYANKTNSLIKVSRLKKLENVFFFLFQGRKGDQVCGKNNITYHSWCHLMKDSCNTGFFIDIKHEGPCIASSWYILILLLEDGKAQIGNGKTTSHDNSFLIQMINDLLFSLFSTAWKVSIPVNVKLTWKMNIKLAAT